MTENNHNHNQQQVEKRSIRDSVMDSIDTGKTKMTPHWHFVAKGVLLIVGIILAVLALLYISSFIIFLLHQTGVWYTPGFGARGVQEFLVHLPWVLIVLAIVFMIVLQYLVKKYSFGYGKPLLYSAVGIIVLVVAGGFIISLTPVHRGLMMQAQDDQLPFAGGFYKMFGAPNQPGNVTPGEIVELLEQGYRINTPRSELLNVIISSDTHYPMGGVFEIGDRIVVIGERSGDSIKAYGITEVGDDVVLPRYHRRGDGDDRRIPMPMY